MPFSDEVLARLDADAAQIIAKYPRPRSALLPLLHLVQSEEGYVSADGIAYCAAKFGLTEAEVTAVVSFYTMYKRRPVGEYHVGVCTNTLCAIMGGDQIFAELREHLGVGNDETTPDGKVLLEHVECNAACDYAPVVMVNWEFFDNQTPESARQLVDDLRAGNPVTPDPGPGPAVHLARGVPDPGRLQRRPGHRRPGGRPGQPGRPQARQGARLDRAGAASRRHRCGQPSRGASQPRGGRPREGVAVTDTLTPVLTAQLGPAGLLHPGRLQARRRLAGAAEGAGHGARRRHHRAEEREPARPRRGRLPDRREVELPAAGRRQAALPGGQRGRVRAGHLQGRPADDGQPARAHRGRGHHGVRDQGQARVHLRPRRGAARGPAAAARGRRRRTRPATSARTSSAPGFDLDVVVHAGAGAYICGEETGAAHLARGLPRPAPDPAAVPGRGGPVRLPDGDQQRGVDRQRPVDRGQRRGLVRRPGHREVQGLRHLLAVRARHHAGPVRGAARHHAARAARPGRRDPGRAPAEVLDPGRLVDPAADRRAPRRAAGLRVGRRRRVHARHPGAADLRRDHLRGPRGAALDRVLRARVVRQVHAVPGGHVLDGPGAGTAGTRPGHRGRPGEAPGHLRQHPRPRVLRPGRRREPARSPRPSSTSGTSSCSTRRKAAARSTRRPRPCSGATR